MLSIGPASSCDICYEQFGPNQKVPWSIQCGHVFCGECIQNINNLRVCPMCRFIFERESCIKLHVEFDIAQGPSSIAAADMKEARRIQRAIASVSETGATEPSLRQLIKEGNNFLASQPRNAHKDLRSAHRIIVSLYEVKMLHRAQTQAIDSIKKQASQLMQEEEELQKQLEKLEETRQYTLVSPNHLRRLVPTVVDIRHHTLFAFTAILIAGTTYSVLQNTYLDASNPYRMHLSHLFSGTYFSTKTKVLDIYFVRLSWEWTSALFFFSYLTSPVQARTEDRLDKYFATTAIWVLFTSWFFGPGLLERFIVASGGECILMLPSWKTLSVPNKLCFSHSIISYQSHPHLFPDGFSATDSLLKGQAYTPFLYKGHHISSHVFLLTLFTLFLADQLGPSLKIKCWSSLHTWAITSNIAMIGLCLLATYATSVYFHSPIEKFTGYLLGLSSFHFIQALAGGDVQIRLRAALNNFTLVVTRRPFRS